MPDPVRVMITGHRSLGGSVHVLRGVFTQLLSRFRARHGPSLVAISGMALGADIEYAQAALDLGIPLTAAVPHEGQAEPWSPQQRARWQSYLERAMTVVKVWEIPGYKAITVGSQLFQRNLWMLDNSDHTIACWDGRKTGGTWNAIREARKRGRRLLIVEAGSGRMRVESPKSEPKEVTP